MVHYGLNFAVTFSVPSGASNEVYRVVFVRFGLVTHSFDGDQRYVSVPFMQKGTDLVVTARQHGSAIRVLHALCSRSGEHSVHARFIIRLGLNHLLSTELTRI